MSTFRHHPVRRVRGFGLIELMIGILLGSILLLGLAKVFSASRTAYQASEGLARVQENSRFAMDFLQRDVRMAGHMGCVNDLAHFLSTPPQLYSHFITQPQRDAIPPTYSAAPFPERFDVGIEGFEATGTAPTNNLDLTAPAGGWNPVLPAAFTAAGVPPPDPGSDVIMLRFFGSDAGAVTAIDLAANTITAPSFTAQEQVNGLYGLSNCTGASVFQASAAAGGVITAGLTPVNKSVFGTGEGYVAKELRVYRAESVAYYVSTVAGRGPSLFRLRFTAAPANPVAEELVEGIENMQILYGRDNSGASPDGAIDIYQTANNVVLGLAPSAVPDAWRRVGAVRLGFLSRSVDRGAVAATTAGSPGSCGDNCVSVLGVNATPPADARVRQSYLTTIALRNRLFGN